MQNPSIARFCNRCAAPQDFAAPPVFVTTALSGKDLSIYLGVAFGFILVIITMFFIMDKFGKYPNTTSAAIAAPAPIAPKTAYYLDYEYSFSEHDGKIMAIFLPKMLPRNDEIMIGATRAVIKQGFGEQTHKEPFIIGITIMYPGLKHMYAVTIVKEDTGEIHTLVIEQIPIK